MIGMAEMNKKIKLIFVLFFILCIPVAFTFSHYYSLSIADFLSFGLKLEPRDQISLPAVADDKFKTFGLTGFSHLSFLDNEIFEQLSLIPFQISFPEPITLVLRC